MRRVNIIHNCHKCNAKMTRPYVVFGDNEPILEMEISLFSQNEFKCPECAQIHIVGDIEIFTLEEFEAR